MNINGSYLNAVKEETQCVSKKFVNEEFDTLAQLIMHAYNFNPPTTLDEAIELFCLLMNTFE